MRLAARQNVLSRLNNGWGCVQRAAIRESVRALHNPVQHHARQDSHGFALFYPKAKTSSIMPLDAGNPLAQSSPKARAHTIMEAFVHRKTGGFCLFLHQRQDLHVSRWWRPIGQVQWQRYEGIPSWAFFFCCCYKTRKSFLRFPPWARNNRLGVYSLGLRISSCSPTKGTPPPITTLRANWG